MCPLDGAAWLAASDPTQVIDGVPREGIWLAIILLVVGLVIGLIRKLLWLAVLAGVVAAAGIGWWWYSGGHPVP